MMWPFNLIRLPWKKYTEGTPFLTPKEYEEAMITISLPNQRKLLMQVMDELVRQGIYLDKDRQDAAKMMIEIIGDLLKKADAIRKKKEKEQARKQ
jgi:hypothetical protein